MGRIIALTLLIPLGLAAQGADLSTLETQTTQIAASDATTGSTYIFPLVWNKLARAA